MTQKKIYFLEFKGFFFKDMLLERSFPINNLASKEINISETEYH